MQEKYELIQETQTRYRIVTGKYYWLRKFPSYPEYQQLVRVMRIHSNGDCYCELVSTGRCGLAHSNYLF